MSSHHMIEVYGTFYVLYYVIFHDSNRVALVGQVKTMSVDSFAKVLGHDKFESLIMCITFGKYEFNCI